jgi:GT2 family glycosyltransferase
VVPTHNRRDRLPPLVQALAEQTLPRQRFEVVFVDDCSTDGSAELLRRLIPGTGLNATVLSTERNTGGPAAGRNLGWRSTEAPVVAFLDDDCVPTSGWLEAGLAAMEAHPRWGVAQGRTDTPPGFDERRGDRWVVWRRVHGESPWFEGTNIFYRRDALEQTGGFDERWPIWGEDTDLGWRVLKAGWERGYIDGAAAEHEVAVRGWVEAARLGWKDRQVVEVAAIHPEVRREGFFLPWAFSRQSAEFAGALIGVTLAARWRPALLLALPYAWCRKPPFRRPGTIRIGLQTLAVDAVRLGGHLAGSAKGRIFVV